MKTRSILESSLKGIINDVKEQKEMVSKPINFFFYQKSLTTGKCGNYGQTTRSSIFCNFFQEFINYVIM